MKPWNQEKFALHNDEISINKMKTFAIFTFPISDEGKAEQTRN